MDAPKPIQVLIAEDDKFLRNVLQAKLVAEGFGVRIAADGEEALAALAETTPDILLLDIIMPKKNGFDVLEDLRLKGRQDVPVVILSNLGQDEDVRRGLALGAVDFLVKSDHSLKDVVEKVKLYAATSRKPMAKKVSMPKVG
jgi:DNA-binding response OmpR family regulator